MEERAVAARCRRCLPRKPDADASRRRRTGRRTACIEEIGQPEDGARVAQKKSARSLGIEERRRMIEPDHPKLPIARQCELLGLARATLLPPAGAEDRRDEPATHAGDRRDCTSRYLVFGSRQMARWLRRQGHTVNRKRVQRLMLADGPGGHLPGAEHVAEATRTASGFIGICSGAI